MPEIAHDWLNKIILFYSVICDAIMILFEERKNANMFCLLKSGQLYHRLQPGSRISTRRLHYAVCHIDLLESATKNR